MSGPQGIWTKLDKGYSLSRGLAKGAVAMDWGEGPVGEVSPGERGLLRSFGRSVQTSQALPSVEGGGATERNTAEEKPPDQ